jgi:hypothetical protein
MARHMRCGVATSAFSAWDNAPQRKGRMIQPAALGVRRLPCYNRARFMSNR